jgi:hypothetical protein
MENAVKEIVEKINPGMFFDSHFVIAQIIKHYSDAYIHFAESAETTAEMHGRIARMIGQLRCVGNTGEKSWSEHIHGEPGKCALWRRLPTPSDGTKP